MNVKSFVVIGLTGVAAMVPAVIAFATTGPQTSPTTNSEQASPTTNSEQASPTLIQTVQDATLAFRDVSNATDYASSGACVNGPAEGAMGIHYANADLIGDGELDGSKPELLIYEQKDGQLILVGVEFIVLAAQWDDPAAGHAPGAPVLQGQLFNFVGAPNRYGLDAFYELHVWAWLDNPNGPFADYNPAVSCDEYVGEGMSGMNHAPASSPSST